MKKVLIIFLVLLALVVWLINARLLKGIINVKPVEQNMTKENQTDKTLIKQDNFVYKPLGYDPFFSFQPPDTSRQKNLMPSLKLRGIVITKKGKLALLETEAKEIFNLKEGEELKGLKLKKITSKSIVLQFGLRQVELKVLE